MQIKITKVHRTLTLIIYGVLCIFALVKGTVYSNDSYGFLAMDFHRSVGYNAFLKIFTSIFGDSFGLPLIVAQLALLIGTTYYLIKTIKQLFNLHYVWLLVLQLILIAPAFYLHYVANAILSEGLAYPLFILFVALVLKGFMLNSIKHYYYSLAILCALLLTRGQFTAMVIMLLVLILVEAFQSKFNKEKMVLILAVVILPLISGLAEKTYNKLVYGHFEKTPFSNVTLITSGFYVSDAEDYKLFSNEEEQLFFKNVYKRIDSLNLSKVKVEASQAEVYKTFHNNYSKISNASIHEMGTNYFKAQGLNKSEQLIAVNNLTGSMLLPLIKDNFSSWLKLYIDNAKNAFGSAKQLLLFLILLIASGFFMIKKGNHLSKFIFAITLIMFANSTIIPLAVHSIKRYLFYTDWIIFAIIILLLNEVFTKKPVAE